jgi:hypothetical protein
MTDDRIDAVRFLAIFEHALPRAPHGRWSDEVTGENAHLFETGSGPRRRGIVVVLNNEIRHIGEKRYTFLASFALQLRQKFRRHFDFSLPFRSLVVLIHAEILRKRSRENFQA